MAKKYGWYSDSSVAAGNKTVWYGMPTGECVECSFVNDNQHVSGTAWPDAVCIGEIVPSSFYGNSAPLGVPVYKPLNRLMKSISNQLSSSKYIGGTKINHIPIPPPPSFWDDDPLLFRDEPKKKPEFSWGTYEKLETYLFGSEVFYLVKDKLNYKKWLCHSDIDRLVEEVGAKDAMSVAFYDADTHFEPPGRYDELV